MAVVWAIRTAKHHRRRLVHMAPEHLALEIMLYDGCGGWGDPIPDATEMDGMT